MIHTYYDTGRFIWVAVALFWLWYKTAHCGSDCKSFYWASFAEITQHGGDLSDCDRSLNNSKNKYNDE